MHSVAQALEIVLAQASPLPAVAAMLTPETLGLVLAEDVVSDLDMPPFDKAMMDGFAVRYADLRDGKAGLTIIEEIPAGKTPTVAVAAGQASRIMTGAPVPQGADAVVMIERCEIIGLTVRVNDGQLVPGQNILRQGREMRIGETVLRAGARLTPQVFGLLATVGQTTVKVQPAPRVAILSTGDELVEASRQPGPGQIRNSNGPMLLAQVARAGGVPWLLGIARDEPGHLRAMIAEGLQADVLLLSGGVSAGKLDLVPGVLAELGVLPLFHKIAMKPGKPLLFGVKQDPHPRPLSQKERGEMHPRPLSQKERGEMHARPLSQKERGALVFGLPGNPVSSLVCFELFVRPAIRALMALPPGPQFVKAALTKDFPYRTERPTYHPARLQLTDAGWTVEPVAWFGSPDLRGVTAANAFVVLPTGDHSHHRGESLMVLRVEDD